MNFVEPIRDIETINKIKNILYTEYGYRNLLLFVMGINTGLRISDLLTLKVKDVINKMYIEIYEQKTGKYKKFPINNSVRQLLEEKFGFGEIDPEEYLFKSREGKNNPITRQMAYNVLNNACKKAGIVDKIGTHTLRKTFGYHHYRANKDIAIVQQMLNHSSPSVTLRYIGASQDEIDEQYRSLCL